MKLYRIAYAAAALIATVSVAWAVDTITQTYGTNAAVGGIIKLFGSTSGDVTIQPAAVAGTATLFQLPATNGSSTNVLQTNGSGVTSWVAASGGTTTIASGAKALATSAISSAACSSAQTDTATGTATTDVVTASFNGDPTAVTGYIPLTAGMLTIISYPTLNTVNFKVCNNTSSSVTPGAITLNWRVVR